MVLLHDSWNKLLFFFFFFSGDHYSYLVIYRFPCTSQILFPPTTTFFSNCCSCYVTVQCNSPKRKLYQPSSKYMSSQKPMIDYLSLWLTRKREYAIPPFHLLDSLPRMSVASLGFEVTIAQRYGKHFSLVSLGNVRMSNFNRNIYQFSFQSAFFLELYIGDNVKISLYEGFSQATAHHISLHTSLIIMYAQYLIRYSRKSAFWNSALIFRKRCPSFQTNVWS